MVGRVVRLEDGRDERGAEKKKRDASDALPESTMYVVTFSGVTSGGMVTSGTTCWTCHLAHRLQNFPHQARATYMFDEGLLDEGSDYRALSDAVWTRMVVGAQHTRWRVRRATHRRRRGECAHPFAWPCRRVRDGTAERERCVGLVGTRLRGESTRQAAKLRREWARMLT